MNWYNPISWLTSAPAAPAAPAAGDGQMDLQPEPEQEVHDLNVSYEAPPEPHPPKKPRTPSPPPLQDPPVMEIADMGLANMGRDQTHGILMEDTHQTLDQFAKNKETMPLWRDVIDEIFKSPQLLKDKMAHFQATDAVNLDRHVQRHIINPEYIKTRNLASLEILVRLFKKDRGEELTLDSISELPDDQKKEALATYCIYRLQKSGAGLQVGLTAKPGISYISGNHLPGLSNQAFLSAYEEMVLKTESITKGDIVRWAIDSARSSVLGQGKLPAGGYTFVEGMDAPPEFYEHYHNVAQNKHKTFVDECIRQSDQHQNNFGMRPAGEGNLRNNWFANWPRRLNSHASHLWGLIFSREMDGGSFANHPHESDPRRPDQRWEAYKAPKSQEDIEKDIESLWEEALGSYKHYQKVLQHLSDEAIHLDAILDKGAMDDLLEAGTSTTSDQTLLDELLQILKIVAGGNIPLLALGESLCDKHDPKRHLDPALYNSDGTAEGSAFFTFESDSGDEDDSFGGGRHKPKKNKSKKNKSKKKKSKKKKSKKKKSKKKKSKKRKTKKTSRKKYGGVLPYYDENNPKETLIQEYGNFNKFTLPFPVHTALRIKGGEVLNEYYDFVIKKDKQIIYLIGGNTGTHGHTSVLDPSERKTYTQDQILRRSDTSRVMNHLDDTVFIAGGIFFDNGLPSKIVNSSGHYMMDTDNFHTALMEINKLYDNNAFGKDIESLWERVYSDDPKANAMALLQLTDRTSAENARMQGDALSSQSHGPLPSVDLSTRQSMQRSADIAKGAAKGEQMKRLSHLGGVSLNNMKFLAQNYPEQYGDGGNIKLYDLLQETLGKRSMSDISQLDEADKTSLKDYLRGEIAKNPDYYMPSAVVEMDEEDDEDDMDSFGGGGRKSKRRKSKRQKKKRKTKKKSNRKNI